MVQRNTCVPYAVTVAVEEPALIALKETDPGPDVLDQVPVPVIGVFPPKAFETNPMTD